MATDGSKEEVKELKKVTKSSKVKNRVDACEKDAVSKRASATSAALRILQSGANSSYMLREKLSRKGYLCEEINEALCEVKEAGLLDDRRLLFAHAEYLATRKYYGKRRVYMELVRKFDRPLVNDNWEKAVEEIDFSSHCLTLAEKNRGKDRNLLAAKLSRQGYTASEIRFALSSLPSNEEDNYT